MLSQKINIEKEDNVGSLYDKLMTIGKELVIETLNHIESGILNQLNNMYGFGTKDCTKTEQGEYSNQLEKRGKRKNSLIKGLSPYPSAWCQIKLNDRLLNFKIFRAKIGEDLNLGA